MNKIYDFIVIGAGISACTFASCLNKRLSDASILLIEHGRRLGGRATTRKSRKNKILEFDHGLPSINFSANVSPEILSFISPLINSNKLVDISNDILIMDESGILSNSFAKDKTFRSLPFMINFSEEIVNQAVNPNKINFLFQTLTKSVKRTKDIWRIQVNDGNFVKSRNLILSSSLIAHPRCLKILGINTLPLRDAFILGQDKIVDFVLHQTRELKFIKRKVYIFYVSDFVVVQNFNQQYLQVLFSQIIREKFNFERIIFQMQSDGSMVIVLHCSYLNNLSDMNIEYITKSLLSLFTNYPKFLDLFLKGRNIDIMNWRASQPISYLMSKELQWSADSRIGFCGDWFNWNNCGGVESAMNSSIRLAQLMN